jgi:hypothetical protein
MLSRTTKQSVPRGDDAAGLEHCARPGSGDEVGELCVLEAAEGPAFFASAIVGM